MLPLGLLPVVLEVLHLCSLGGVSRVIQSMLEATLPALAQAGECQSNDCQDTGGRGASVNSDVRTVAKVGPFLGQGLGRGFVELVQDGRVSAGRRRLELIGK